MTIADFLSTATATLKNAGIDSARLDSLVLLEDELGKDRTVLLAYPETEIPTLTEVDLNKKVIQRATHMPLAYIRGKANFYGRTFVVTPDVLVPRPETEAMIELLKDTRLPAHPHIVDIGAGSGCIGITAALELARADVQLLDIDNKALAVAANNAEQLGAKNVQLQTSDLLKNNTKLYDVVLANLPYVPNRYAINQAATHEPRLALFAGDDGLDLYRRLWQQVANLPQKPHYVLTEALLQQHDELAKIAEDAGYQLTKTQGLAQHFTLNA